MLSFQEITLAHGANTLLDKASFIIYEKQKIGIVGRNGCGKTTLFSMIRQELIPEHGQFQFNKHLQIAYLAQHIPESTETAVQYVLGGDEAYQQLETRLKNAEANNLHHEVLACHDALNQTGGYSKPALAASILAGLGFSREEQEHSVNSFSGGWRMRLNLARCLMKPADLFLLDEPTNHLDMEAIFWLEKWLKLSGATLLVISHDREFLDKFVTHILHFDQKNINIYTGNYSRFEILRAEQLSLQQKNYEKQQERINHLMSYVDRFRAKASKAKQAQSRLKLIDKMELVAQAHLDSPFNFSFPEPGFISNPLLHCEHLNAGYDPRQPILKTINFQLNNGDRIALLGPNGQGKSTFVKTLTGVLAPLTGELQQAANLKIGYYAQHQLDELDFRLSPIATIQALSPESREQEIRNFLGGFDFAGDMATTAITHFSGGEKARLALAKLVWQKPNLLLLDEPTNHLDLDMRTAIEMALQTFTGALILISHDRRLLKSSVDQFYLVYQGHVKLFKGDLDDYHQWLITKDCVAEKTSITYSESDHKERKNQKNRLKKIEQLIADLQQKLTNLEHRLTDSTLYETQSSSLLHNLLDEQKMLQEKLTALEEEWISIVLALEEQ